MSESNITVTMKAIFLLLLLPLQLFSQDLSGIWVGTIATSQTEMPFELVINQDLTGYSMISFMYKGEEKVAVKKMELIRKDSTFTISDDKLVYNNFATGSRNIKTFCELSIKLVDTVMVLSGPFHTRARDRKAGDEDLSTGTITLRKQNIQAQTKLIGKLDSLKLSNTLSFSNPQPATRENSVVAAPQKEVPAVVKTSTPATSTPVASVASVPSTPKPTPPAPKPTPPAPKPIAATPKPVPPAPRPVPAAAEVAKRKTQVIQTIAFRSDSLTLVLFDNGIVDGDTVSVVLNGKVIIPKQGLTDQEYRKVIKLSPDMGDSLQLVIYAENLGTIPPNSGMLIIWDGSDRHEVGFEGDFSKSSAVTLRRRQ